MNLNYTDNCLGKIARCTNEIICVGAKTQPLYFGSGDAYWSEHPVFQKYVLEAKRRKQDCGKF